MVQVYISVRNWWNRCRMFTS